MNFFRTWLMGVVAAALAVALALALTPEGAVKKAGRLVGGLVLLLAVVRPLMQLDPGTLAVTAAAYGVTVETVAEGGEIALEELIAERVGAYIADKGAALGCSCTARVTVEQDENGWPLPVRAEITGTWTEGQRQALSRAIAQELDIPAEEQSFFAAAE